MSAATSPGTGLAYGLRRVCAAWGMARSSFYAMTSGQHAKQPPTKRRGPKPAISDQALLVAIEADLEASPWEGEGYRKVWARSYVQNLLQKGFDHVAECCRGHGWRVDIRYRSAGHAQPPSGGLLHQLAFVLRQ